MLETYLKVSESLTRWLLAAACGLLLLMLALIGVEVTARNLFGVSTKIADEYAGYLFCWLTLLGFLYVARRDQFIRVEFVWNRAGGRAKQALMILSFACGLALCLIVAHATLRMTLTSFAFNSASAQYSQTPLAIPQAMMPVAFSLLAALYAIELGIAVVRLAGGPSAAPSGRPR